MSFNDTPLWTFLSIGYSEKFASLCVKDKLYYDGVMLDFFINSESNDTEAERGVIDLFSNIFCSDVLDSIKECVYNGCNILIHTNDNNNAFTGISAANFAITPCGIWINYIATKCGHFL